MRKAIASAAVLAAALAPALLSVGAAQAAQQGTLDQASETYRLGPWSNGDNGQTFTPTVSGLVSGIDLYEARISGSATYDVTIRAAQNGLPTGPVLGTGSATVSSVGWFSVPITSTAPVTAGGSYAISFQGPSNAYVGCDTNVYPGGGAIYMGQSYASSYDLAFREYVVAGGTISGTPTSNTPVDHSYSYDYTVGGYPAPTLSVVDGTLPAGLTLSQSGRLSGTPTEVGSSTFTIRSANDKGQQDVTSTIVVRPAAVPSAPGDVTAAAGAGSATVSWSAPTDAGDDPVTGYTVTSTPGNVTATTAGTSATIDGLTPGTAYTFQVAATSASGTGAASGPSTAVTPYTTPSAPVGFRMTPGDGSVELNWAAPASDGFSPLTGYTISQSVDGGPWADVATPAAADTSAVIDGLQNGSTYEYRIAASNAAGTGPAASSNPTTPFGVAGSPQAVKATGDDESVSLTWSAPADANGAPVTGYQVEYSSDGSTWSEPIAAATGSAHVTGLTNGTEYSFRVAAVNAAGTGPWSELATATPLTVASAPNDLAVNPADGAAVLSWTAPTDDGGAAVTGYRVEYRAAGADWTGVDASTSPVTISSLDNGSRYEFRVRAVTPVGPGTPSASVSTTPFVFDPTARIDGDSIDGTTLSVGARVHLGATDLPAGATVTIDLHSTPVRLAAVTIGDDGVLDTDVIIPAGTAAGAHELVLTLDGTGADPVTVSHAFTVAPATVAATTTAVARQAAAELAFTGSTISPLLVGGAALAVLLGVGLIVVRRRRA
ncbi:fibronectin type III domain-containing protein [Curtobacterium sp. Curtsp57]|uniref:fibronectin type III domain-containing protein n=1 Tax=Curtobacterium sp. Curtsp57 TaxID=3243047 RepID=UPI0039B4959F